MAANSNTATSKSDSVVSDSSSTDRSQYAPAPAPASNPAGHTQSSLKSLSFSLLNSSRHKSSSVSMLYVLTVSATVTRLKWRPPANVTLPTIQGEELNSDLHESMIAVATAPIKGASAGGSGVLSLWTYNRPFMPLSVLEGHQVGAVTDFYWLDTPRPDSPLPRSSRSGTHGINEHLRGPGGHGMNESDIEGGDNTLAKRGMGVWQHVLSVGRDGQCLIQSFARGSFGLWGLWRLIETKSSHGCLNCFCFPLSR